MPIRFALIPLLLLLASCGGGGGGEPPGAMIDTHGLFLGNWACFLEPSGTGDGLRIGIAIDEMPNDPAGFWARVGHNAPAGTFPCFLLEQARVQRDGNSVLIEFDSLTLWLQTDPTGQGMAGRYQLTGGACAGGSGALTGYRSTVGH